MELNEIRLLSETKKLAVVVQQSKINEWIIKVSTGGGEESLLSSAQKKVPRIFKTTDECIALCSSVGIKNFVIKW